MSGGGAPQYERYRTGSSDEWMMRIGPADAPPILFLPPLFEEMNRTRAFIVGVMRALAEQGNGCWLPDLPGTGESEHSLDVCSWEDWRRAAADAGEHVRSCAAMAPPVASIRGGCLLDDAVQAKARWRFAPVAGSSLTRDLARSSLMKANEGAVHDRHLAGYPIPPLLFAAIEAAEPALVEARTVRLVADRSEADRKLTGPALWRRAEPESSSELSATISDDISAWFRECADF